MFKPTLLVCLVLVALIAEASCQRRRKVIIIIVRRKPRSIELLEDRLKSSGDVVEVSRATRNAEVHEKGLEDAEFNDATTVPVISGL